MPVVSNCLPEASLMVPGKGPIPAAGMIIGEAPGRDEVKAGEPFVGRAGKLLTSALQALGVSRDEVYITNVVKEIPLDSNDKIRRPFDSEIEAWRPILEGEIQNVAPEAILVLGRTATQALTSIDGERVPFGSKVGNIYTAMHPAAFFYGRPPIDREEWLEQIRPWAEALGKFEYPS